MPIAPPETPPDGRLAVRPATSGAARRLLGALCILTLPLASVSAQNNAPAPDTIEATPALRPVSIPLRLDYRLLETLLESQVFTGKDGSLVLGGTLNACSRIVLREPQLRGANAQLQLLTDINAEVGIGGRGACTTVFSFDGGLAVTGEPEIRRDGGALAFAPTEVRLRNRNGQRVRDEALEALALSGVRSAFNSYEYDLSPQLASVGDVLPAFLPRQSRQQLESLIETLRIDTLDVQDEAVAAQIRLEVETISGSAPPESALSEAELAEWEARWQAMDALLVLAVKHYAQATSLQALRDALLDALIESRYRLRDALADSDDGQRDAVRAWFLQSWQTLAPTLRRIGLEQVGREELLVLDIITAADALQALDELGPSVGLEISVDGLRRLARMINGGAGADILTYSLDVDPDLRRLFDEQLGSTPPASSWRMGFSLFPRAIAADANRLNRWAPQREDLPEYLPTVADLLRQSADTAKTRHGLDSAYETLYRNLVLTTAWQESCWRHYVVSDERKLVPLRSGTGDVGLMQVNERVWRGFYDQQRLRWDIEYNSAAGAEVLIDYLMKYALRKGEHRQPGGLANLARASYSAYNGGPSRLGRYRSASASAYGRKVDEAFWEKYQQVAAGNELAVSTCLGGNLSGPAVRTPGASDTTSQPGRGTGAARTRGPYVLQLGAFSSESAARSFIEQRGLGERARVHRRRGSEVGQYLVIYGDFPTRDAADAARAGLGKLESFPRRLEDL